MKTFHFDIEADQTAPDGCWQQTYLTQQIKDETLAPIPSSIIDRDGKHMDTSDDAWLFNMGPSTCHRTWRIKSPLLKHAITAFTINRTQRISASAGLHAMDELQSLLTSCPSYPELESTPDIETYRQTLVKMMYELIYSLRRDQVYWRFWFPAAWYKWGASRPYNLGFSPEFGVYLNSLRIPGSIKGEGARSEDPVCGPLDPELERPLLQLALAADTSTKRKHLQQQLAVALGLAFGRNPNCFRLLLECDFTNLGSQEGGTLKLPEIKKRGKLRAKLTEMPLEPALAELVDKLIRANASISSNFETTGNNLQKTVESLLRPIFMRIKPSPVTLKSDDKAYALGMSNPIYNGLLKGFVKRHAIVSPCTAKLMHINSRRLRYTFATDMVDLGLSPAELAFALGHTDTQNVRVYFGIGARIVPHLEKAATGRIEPLLNAFSTAPPEQSMAEQLPLIRRSLHAPISCYLCPAFRPSEEVKHSFLVITRSIGEVEPSIAGLVEQIAHRIASLPEHLQQERNSHGD